MTLQNYTSYQARRTGAERAPPQVDVDAIARHVRETLPNSTGDLRAHLSPAMYAAQLFAGWGLRRAVDMAEASKAQQPEYSASAAYFDEVVRCLERAAVHPLAAIAGELIARATEFRQQADGSVTTDVHLPLLVQS